MAFERPTLSTLYQRNRSDMTTALARTGAWLRRAVLEVLAKVLSGAVHGLYGFIDIQKDNLFTDTADEAHVRREAAQYGLQPTAATKATGTVTVSGTVGATVEADTVLQRSDEVEFRVLADVTLGGATAEVTVEAVSAGAAGNTVGGTPLAFVSPVAGVSSTANVGVSGLTGGLAEEDVESLRSRLLERKRNPAQGGSEPDYKRWVREVFPTARVWVYPLLMGPRSVGITFVLPDREDIVPATEDVDLVIAYLSDKRPVTASLTVFAPIATPLNITMWVVPNTAEVKAAVEAEIADAIVRDTEPGGTILLSRLDEAASIANGETDHAITIPAADITASSGHVLVPGTITWVAP